MYYMFLANGFEITEAMAPLDIMRRAGLEVKTVGVTGDEVQSSNGVNVKADCSLSQISFEEMEGAILPGGMPGTLNLKKNTTVIDSVRYCYDNGKLVAAICAAPSIFGSMGLLRDRKATCFPGFEKELTGAVCTGMHTETDGNVITAKGAGCALVFGHAIISYILSKEAADKVLSDMQCF